MDLLCHNGVNAVAEGKSCMIEASTTLGGVMVWLRESKMLVQSIVYAVLGTFLGPALGVGVFILLNGAY